MGQNGPGTKRKKKKQNPKNQNKPNQAVKDSKRKPIWMIKKSMQIEKCTMQELQFNFQPLNNSVMYVMRI
jgi:hypothetical protein